MAKVSIRIVRSDKREFTLNNSHWKIPSDGLDGFGSFTNEISTIDDAIGDGGIISSHRLAPKDRTIIAKSRNPSLSAVLRDEATAFFNPKMTYKIYLTYMGRTRWAEGHLQRFDLPTGNIHQTMTLTVTFLFADPYLKSYEDFGKEITSIVGTSGFPYLCTKEQGLPTGVFNFSDAINLSNDGDVEAYCKIVLTATGTVTNPKIIINGHYVRVIDIMQKYDVIIMDFAVNPPTVKKNGVNYIGHCDRTSEFDQMGLIIGNSILQYDADNGSDMLEISVYYNKLYTAI